ncbi:MAG: hypothetical protein JWL59_1792 [Chthoniobacteraceae bacterium]|nr:hypothetical protein [Chthoniobacteraceae bacterium]
MPNPKNQNERKNGLFPWWMAVAVGTTFGVSMGFMTGHMNVCAFGGWGLGALAALLFGRRS